jgi:hypothetical protein
MAQTSPSEDMQERTGWTGWIAFAGIMLIIGGSLQALYGFFAVINDDWAVWGQEAVVLLDLTTWGWVTMIWGIVLIFVGVGLFSGNMVARVLGAIAASVSLIGNFFFLPAAPFWAIIVIAIDAMIIWAIVVHGREMKSA